MNRVRLAVCEGVSVFNTGAGSKALLLQSLGFNELGAHCWNHLKKEDQNKEKNVKRKSSNKFRAQGTAIRMKRKAKQGKKSEQCYEAGAFGLGMEQDIGSNLKRKSRKRKMSVVESEDLPQVETDPCIIFVNDEQVLLTIA